VPAGCFAAEVIARSLLRICGGKAPRSGEMFIDRRIASLHFIAGSEMRAFRSLQKT
jgi:hypothetical protein